MQTTIAIGSEIHKVDTIEFEGQLWIVPMWLMSEDKKWQRPLRIVCLSLLEYDQVGPGEYLARRPIPAALFEEQVPAAIQGFLVREMPEIMLPSPAATN